MIDIDTICKTPPNPNNSNTFVDVLRSHTGCAQLSSSDYRSILLQILADDVTESGNGIQRDFGGPIPKMSLNTLSKLRVF